MVGNAEDAALAQRRYDADDWTDLLSDMGSTRMIYLINGIVYKVEGFNGTNKAEYDIMNNMRSSLPTGVFYPEVSLFNVDGGDVIAMEYIAGEAIYDCICNFTGDKCDEGCMTENEKALLIPLMDDPSGRNVIRNDEGLWIIDAA